MFQIIDNTEIYLNSESDSEEDTSSIDSHFQSEFDDGVSESGRSSCTTINDDMNNDINSNNRNDPDPDVIIDNIIIGKQRKRIPPSDVRITDITAIREPMTIQQLFDLNPLNFVFC